MTNEYGALLNYHKQRDAESDASARKTKRDNTIESAEKSIVDTAFSVATKGLSAACGMTKASARAVKPLIGIIEVGRGLFGATKSLATIFNEEQASPSQSVLAKTDQTFQALRKVDDGTIPTRKAPPNLPGLEAAQ
jgi:phage tail tape-measure protein